MTPGRIALGLIGLTLLGAAQPARERIVSGDGIVAFTVGAQSGRMRIDPAAAGRPLLTTDIATRAGLKGGMIGAGYSVGPEKLFGPTAVARMTVDSVPLKRRVGWLVPPYAAGLDGVMGPGALDEAVVHFALRSPRPGERTITLPMVDSGGPFGGVGGLFGAIDVSGEVMRVRFDPHHARTLATAGAAVRLAAAYGGVVSGTAMPVEIAFGIKRPVRTLTLTRPLTIGPFMMSALGVRTADFGDATAIPDENADPDEVIVTASTKRNPDRDRISIGADLLDRCSSIIFDKPAAKIRLHCT